MKDIVSKYLKEHDRGNIQLTFFNDAVNRIIRSGFDREDFEILKSSVHYFETEIKAHCRSEELSLYPVLSSVIAPGDIFEMKYEHEKIDEALLRLRSHLQIIEEPGPSEPLLVKLKVDARGFVQLLSNHIRKEDEYFFLLAKKTLTGRDLNQVLRMHKERV